MDQFIEFPVEKILFKGSYIDNLRAVANSSALYEESSPVYKGVSLSSDFINFLILFLTRYIPQPNTHLKKNLRMYSHMFIYNAFKIFIMMNDMFKQKDWRGRRVNRRLLQCNQDFYFGE